MTFFIVNLRQFSFSAPTAFIAHGIAKNKNVTSYPSVKSEMEEGKYIYKEEDVVIDGNIITSRGPGTAFKFALKLVDMLVSKEKACEVAKTMLLTY